MTNRTPQASRIGHARLVALDTVQPERVEWLWPGRIPRGKLSLLAGDPGLGKSLITLDMAARVSRGMDWPDDREHTPAGTVIILSAEDDAADTIRPRLDAAGADVAKVVLLQGIESYDTANNKPCSRVFSLERDIRALEEACRKYGDTRLVIIDPVSAYCGRTDSHKNADVRGLLAPLAELAARQRVAVEAVTHLNKGDGPAMYRSMGSLAFVAVARAAWGIVGSPFQPGTRLMLPIKCNLSADTTGLSYIVVERVGVPCIAWSPIPVTTMIDEVLGVERQPKGGRSAERREAAEWLRRELAGGAVAAKDLEARAQDAGLKWRTVQRAKDDLGVRDVRDGFGPGARWLWALPSIDTWSPPGGENGNNGTYERPIDTIDATRSDVESMADDGLTQSNADNAIAQARRPT